MSDNKLCAESSEQDAIPSIEGIFALDKPIGISSQKAVAIVKWWARKCSGNKKIRVGHAGTLDPLASGVLVIAVGRTYTRQLEEIVQKEKEYSAEITFGVTTTTDDAEGEKTVQNVAELPQRKDVEVTIQKFIGEIKQVPPLYSAAKISGQEGYKRARRGEIFNPGEHHVTVKEIDVLEYAYPSLKIRVTTGSGVYIRSLARDIGAELNVGGYLSALERIRVGQFLVEDARQLDDFQEERLKKTA